LAKGEVASFKHNITAQMGPISPIWTPSRCARDVGGLWMSPTLVRSGRRLHRIDPISGCARFVCQRVRHRPKTIIACSSPSRACLTVRLLNVHSEPFQTPAARVGLIGLLHHVFAKLGHCSLNFSPNSGTRI